MQEKTYQYLKLIRNMNRRMHEWSVMHVERIRYLKMRFELTRNCPERV